MKAKIFSCGEAANDFTASDKIDVRRVEVQMYLHESCGVKWSEERIIVYYEEKKC